MCCASAPGYSDGDQRHHVARALGRQLRAQHDGAAREVAAEPAGAAHDVGRVEPVRPLAQLLEERAADVLLDLLARLLDRDLGERGDGGEVQELDRLGLRPAGREQHDAADPLVAGGDRDLGHHARRGTGATRPRACSPT